MQGFSWKKMQGNSGVFVLPSAGCTPDFPSADENRLSVFLVQHRNDDFLLWGVKSHFWVSGSSVGLLSHFGSAEIGLIFVTSGPSHVAVRLEIQPKAGGIHLRVKNWKLCIFVATTWFCVVFPCRCSAVFTWTNLLVVVVELCGCEQEALDLVPLVTNVVLEEHYLIVGVVVVVDPGVIPINSRGEKQRMHLRDSFLADQLDPIYVAYNMWWEHRVIRVVLEVKLVKITNTWSKVWGCCHIPSLLSWGFQSWWGEGSGGSNSKRL